jgi:CxxC motif-containing protein (DUF1111 family)
MAQEPGRLVNSARSLLPLAVACLSGVLAGCGDAAVPAPEALEPELGEELGGGATTVFDMSRNAFALPARNLSSDHRDLFFLGNTFFNRNWVAAPASTTAADGLGPVYNATSCSACHFKDGRGAPPESLDEPMLGLLLRLSVPGFDDHGGPAPDPRYGGQFNHRAILGVPAEGTAQVIYEERAGAFTDGTPYSLRAPTYLLSDLAFGPTAPDLMISPRVAPFMIGLGLLEAVAEETLLELADAEDRDGDGISGRPNRVWDVRRGAVAIGRFGWKANQPTIEQQASGAFLGDIGITSELFPDQSCPAEQTECGGAPTGGDPEISVARMADVSLYSRTLAVPARRGWTEPNVLRGKALFEQAGCAACHLPKLETGSLEGIPELDGQVIRPYTDLLLHDMGEDLADGRPDFEATGSEWRTPPLWGIGLVHVVNQHTYFLHDGRARDLGEAILWHGGEAEPSREAFRAMPEPDRRALLDFLGSL